MQKLIFGIDLGGTSVKIGLFGENEGLLEDWEIKTRKENNGAFILGDISDFVLGKIKEKNISKDDVMGIGIGVPGPISSDGTIFSGVNLGWGTFNVEKELESLSGFSVKAGNDANVAALGEMWEGGGKNYKNLVLITLGTGVGGGVIMDGKIVSGTNGSAGEIGHMPVTDDETELCGCGKYGCLEQVASATGIVKVAKRLLANSHVPSKLRDIKNLNSKDVFAIASEGDSIAIEVTEILGKYLGTALANISSVIDPEIFVLGGGVSKAGQVLIDLVQKYYKVKVFSSCKDTKIVLAELGNQAGIYGAAKTLIDSQK
ncbi:MAG: ROK family glucokinase [Clostridiales bacterium]|nr:ROK family glucokinase [Clostridiales bacterium]